MRYTGLDEAIAELLKGVPVNGHPGVLSVSREATIMADALYKISEELGEHDNRLGCLGVRIAEFQYGKTGY